MGLVADAAIESNDGAVIGLADVLDEGVGGDGIADEEDEVVVGGEGHRLATTHRREKGNFVAGFENGRPGSEFLIARGDDGRAIGGQCRRLAGETVKEFGDRRARADLDGLLGPAGEFFKFAEK